MLLILIQSTSHPQTSQGYHDVPWMSQRLRDVLGTSHGSGEYSLTKYIFVNLRYFFFLSNRGKGNAEKILLILTMISIVVTAYSWYRIATGNDKLIVNTNVICRLRASDIELRKV